MFSVKYLIASHDAGGAEIVSSWVRQNPQNDYRFVVDGPAVSIFRKKLKEMKIKPVAELKRLADENDFVLTGSSQSSALEKEAIIAAKLSNTKSVTFLDYWYGYKERFELDGKMVLPDEIWVADEYALELAGQNFPKHKIILKTNPYLQELLEEKAEIVPNIKNSDELRIIYLCQPYRQEYSSNCGEGGYITDVSAVEYFLQKVFYYLPHKPAVRLRIHPSETKEKYRNVIQSFSSSVKVAVGKDQSLAEDLVWADWAVGMHAQALAIALSFDLEVFHCIPPGSNPCALPHKEIRDFNDIKAKVIAPSSQKLCKDATFELVQLR